MSHSTRNPALEELVNRLVHTDDPTEVRDLYRQWSNSYEQDLKQFGYVAPETGLRYFIESVTDKSAHLLDAGCGTGLVGQLLSEAGFTHIDGSDFSIDMLRLARCRQCYQALAQADYTQTLNTPDNHYDGIISIGVYTKRFQGMFINEMLRILKPAGCLLFSCRPLYFEEVSNAVQALHVSNKIIRSAVNYDHYMTGQNASAYYVALHKA